MLSHLSLHRQEMLCVHHIGGPNGFLFQRNFTQPVFLLWEGHLYKAQVTEGQRQTLRPTSSQKYWLSPSMSSPWQ